MATGARKLLNLEREDMILSRVNEGVCGIMELSEALGVSEATIRRDLEALEKRGRLRRVRGGAARVAFPRVEPLFQEKEAFHPREKRRIADLALAMIENGDTIYLDGGSTVLGLAKRLEERRGLTVVTNSLMAAARLMESAHRLIIVGGEFRALSRTMVGPLTASIINAINVDKAFLGTIGFTLQDGFSTTDPNEAYTKELVMKRARKVIALIDSSKLGAPSFTVSGSIRDIDAVITDPGISPQFAEALKKLKIDVLF